MGLYCVQADLDPSCRLARVPAKHVLLLPERTTAPEEITAAPSVARPLRNGFQAGTVAT
jgi:hypothetical protein